GDAPWSRPDSNLRIGSIPVGRCVGGTGRSRCAGRRAAHVGYGRWV
ncbi:MAG: hypothetical protein AVDCRST_MAG33-2373, partial [uncultured Thermomicrobiales bacterium]